MPNIPVAAQAIQISQSITQAANIQNNGPGVLYLGQDSSVSTTAYAMRVTSGASVGWPANSELWAISDSTSFVAVLYGAAGVTVSEVNGKVTVGSGLTLLASNVGSSFYSTMSLAPYTSLLIRSNNPSGGAGASPAPMEISWFDDAGNTVWQDYSYQLATDATNWDQTLWTIPIRGVVFNYYAPVLPGGITSLFGSTVAGRQYGHTWQPGGPTNLDGAVPPGYSGSARFATLAVAATSPPNYNLPTVSGDSSLSFSWDSALSGSDLMVISAYAPLHTTPVWTRVGVWYITPSMADYSYSTDWVMPEAPLYWTASNQTAHSQNVNISATYAA